MGRKSTFNAKDAAEIYALCDPRDGAIRYIGKANCSAKRLKSHMRDSRRRRTPVYDWMRSLARDGLGPMMHVLEVAEDWREAERRLISEARSNGCRLLNVAEGGDEPFCPTEVRAQNARDLNARLAADPKAAQIREWKRALANGLRLGQVANRTRAKMRHAAALAPHLFGEWASIPDRQEA